MTYNITITEHPANKQGEGNKAIGCFLTMGEVSQCANKNIELFRSRKSDYRVVITDSDGHTVQTFESENFKNR